MRFRKFPYKSDKFDPAIVAWFNNLYTRHTDRQTHRKRSLVLFIR